MDIEGRTKTWTINKLHQMQDQKPAEKLLFLLEILVRLSASKDLKSLLALSYKANNNGDTDKINMVFEFIMKNYRNRIYIKEIAAKLNMSLASFSRYFKYHTRKTFSDYVTEIRISHACQLLMENDKSVSEICYASGFDNLSNYYRHFKKNIGITPLDYRNRFLESPFSSKK